ncbi:unnamed protein product [Hyaloperonospora brassicae]|uniref:Uncharacterized protein n=1 Tax=Hyaloperonospora brassicae TaxID=162125 RepID=A0AAV0UQI5_HYABA|nr:unnamed protein product [Hyaloperonospora brassicae]
MGATPPTAHARGLTTPVPLASNDRTTAARKPPSATARSKPSVTRNTPQNGLPKGINYKLLRALKPGKQRQAYLKRLMKRCGAVKLQQVTETISSATIGARPWLSVNANESLTASKLPATTTTDISYEGCSLLESMEPRNGRIRCRSAPAAFSSDAMQEEICRGLENYAFELARDAAMPPDDLVDYVVYMASIKASNVGELVGTFDDSAAVAVGIVIEEYMAQLVEDHVLHQQSLCLPSKASVQAFTQEILHGFNWQLFQRQHPCSCSKTADSVVTLVDKEAMLVDKLAALVLHEFVSLQPQDFDVKDHNRDLLAWIRSAIAIPPSLMTDDASCRSSVEKVDDQHRGEMSTRFESCQDPAVVEARGTPRIRMSVKANAVHGNPSYKLHYAAKCMDGHHVEASVGGLDSKVKANATMSQLAKVVQHHEQKSMGTPKDSLPAPRPPPVLQPPHCKEGEDPYSSMYDHVWKHFDEYACRKRQMSSDANRSSTSSDGEGRTTSRELQRNGEARAHCSEI